MRCKAVVLLIFVMGFSAMASTTAAQPPAQNPSTQPPPAQPDQGQRPMGGMMAPGMMNPDMMQMMGRVGGRGQRSGGPLQMVSKLLAALDDPRVRTMLGLSDQQAESLRKIIIDTETFTIKTGADIAVDSIDLRELLRADKPDKNAVMSKGDEISKLTAQLINRYLEGFLAAKAILTPEQQKMLRAYLARSTPEVLAPVRP
jgi:Heavy-metal resistance